MTDDKNTNKTYIDKAQEHIDKGDVIDFIVKTANKFHYGDQIELEISYCTALTMKIRNSRGLHIDMVGGFGTGKSHIQRTIGWLLPQERIISGHVSPKVLFYDNEIPDGLILFMDDKQPGKELTSLMKQTTTRFHEKVNYRTLNVKTQYALNLFCPAEIVYWINYNFTSIDDALNSRFLIFNTDESTDRKRMVHNFITRIDKEGFKEFYEDPEGNVKTCREIFNLFPKCPVAIPFETERYFEIQPEMDLRERNIAADLIRCSALLNYKHRSIDIISKDLIRVHANEDDLKNVKRMWEHVFKHTGGVKKNLTKNEAVIYGLLLSNKELTQSQMSKMSGIARPHISKALKDMKEKCGDIEYKKETIYERDNNGAIKTVRTEYIYFLNL